MFFSSGYCAGLYPQIFVPFFTQRLLYVQRAMSIRCANVACRAVLGGGQLPFLTQCLGCPVWQRATSRKQPDVRNINTGNKLNK